jgi:hypothetical protein
VTAGTDRHDSAHGIDVESIVEIGIFTDHIDPLRNPAPRDSFTGTRIDARGV